MTECHCQQTETRINDIEARLRRLEALLPGALTPPVEAPAHPYKAEIPLVFNPVFRLQILAGKKKCTFRQNRWGMVGSSFCIDDKSFRITDVFQTTLENYILNYWQDAGFYDSEECREFFEARYLTPGGNRAPFESVLGYVHEFEKVGQ